MNKTTVERSAFVAEARTWLDTPYRHQGRLKGVGVDCIGLVIGACRELGLFDLDVGAYPARPDGTLRARIAEHSNAISYAEAQPGDVLLFHWAGVPTHVGIVTDPGHLIHSYAVNRKVIEHRIDARWSSQIVCAFPIPGVV